MSLGTTTTKTLSSYTQDYSQDMYVIVQNCHSTYKIKATTWSVSVSLLLSALNIPDWSRQLSHTQRLIWAQLLCPTSTNMPSGLLARVVYITRGG